MTSSLVRLGRGAAAVALIGGASVVTGLGIAEAAPTTTNFAFTGGFQSFTVPPLSLIHI